MPSNTNPIPKDTIPIRISLLVAIWLGLGWISSGVDSLEFVQESVWIALVIKFALFGLLILSAMRLRIVGKKGKALLPWSDSENDD